MLSEKLRWELGGDMTRLIWGAQGERYYETGVDRGVLYVGTDTGVAWNGLVSVAESPSGGEAKPFYLDGRKYLNISAAEEFEATLNAFSSPLEFGPCDGQAAIQNGLFVTQQPRKSFGLAYRTRIGNDTEGNEYGYRIHLVYNALADPSSNDRKTVDDNVSVLTYSWKITTLAPYIRRYKPSAHLIIDTRYTDPDVLSTVEGILYGDDSQASRLPDPAELSDIFAG